MSSNRKHSFASTTNQPSSQFLLERLDRSVGTDFVAPDHQLRMFETNSTPRYYSPSTYSIESFAGEDRYPARTTLNKMFSRRRSVTISTSGSSCETATNAVTASMACDASEDQTLLNDTRQSNSSERSEKMRNRCSPLSRKEPLPSLNAPSDSSQSLESNRADDFHPATILPTSTTTEGHLKLDALKNVRKVGSLPLRCETAEAGRNAEAAALPQKKKSSMSIRDSLNDVMHDEVMPLQTGPRLIHRSPPPWAVSGRDEACAERSKGSNSRFGPDDQAIEYANSSHHSRQSPSQNQSRTGLKKLLKSVKVSLWSAPPTSSDFPRKPSHDKPDTHGLREVSVYSNQSSVSGVSVDAQSITTLARNHPNHFSTVGPDDSTASLSRTVSACSILSVGTATTTTTTPSASITPSSSWSSLPGAQSDYSIASKPGLRCSNDQLSEMRISLDPSELDRHTNMASPHTLTCAHSPSRYFDSSFGPRSIHNSQDHQSSPTRVLKSKPSFGFLHNLKRAVTGADPTLSFSFHNHLTPSLTTSAVSLPIGTVLRNNGLDPLPPCHPLPLKSSQSSPSNLDYSTFAPTRLDPQRFESAPSPRAVSLFSSSQGDFPTPPRSDPSYLHESSSQTQVLQVPPTLNLRPVSMPFAAGFSDQFLFDGSNPVEPQNEDLSVQLGTNEPDEESCDHHLHCSRCRSLTDENATLKTRIRELEMMIAKSTCST